MDTEKNAGFAIEDPFECPYVSLGEGPFHFFQSFEICRVVGGLPTFAFSKHGFHEPRGVVFNLTDFSSVTYSVVLSTTEIRTRSEKAIHGAKAGTPRDDPSFKGQHI